MSEGKIRPLIASGDQAALDAMKKMAQALITRAEVQALAQRIASDISALSHRLAQIEQRLDRVGERLSALDERAHGREAPQLNG